MCVPSSEHILNLYFPLLLCHSDPLILPHVQVDKGAIKFVLSGANIMCPGLTSPGARMDTALPENTIVVSFYACVLQCIEADRKAVYIGIKLSHGVAIIYHTILSVR